MAMGGSPVGDEMRLCGTCGRCGVVSRSYEVEADGKEYVTARWECDCGPHEYKARVYRLSSK